jgi:hypothetical protein
MKNKQLLFIFIMLLTIISLPVYAETYLESTGSDVAIRTGPSTSGTQVLKRANVGDRFDLVTTDLVKTQGGCDSGYWYKIKYNGQEAYFCSTYGKVVNTTPVVITAEAKSACEAELKAAGFPETYWNSLCTLKAKYPAWTFEAVNTGYDFAAAVQKEACKNSISTSTRADFQDNTCGKSYDSGYTGASQAALAYYMNPLNFLDEQNIFMFESAYINENIRPYYTDLVQKMSNSTLLGFIPALPTYIANASPESGASATFLAARVRVELGTGKLSSGNYKGQLQSALSGNYTTRYGYYYNPSSGWSKSSSGRSSVDNYYNFYNIGASDGDGVTQRALAYAFKQGWGGPQYDQNTARQVAVTGGAKWTYNYYINVGQQTMYFNKFNFNPKSTHSASTHQYMTNVEAPVSEGKTLYNAYNSMGKLSLGFKFVIPVYSNTSAQIDNSSQGATGDTNNTNTGLSPSTMVVSSGYSLSGTTITNVHKDTNISDFAGRISSQGGTVEIYSGNNRVTSGSIGTGMTVKVTSSAGTTSFNVVVKGDASGDGKVNALDLLQIQKSILGQKSLSGVYSQAADPSGDGKVNALDLLQIQKNILGQKEL